MTNLSCMCMYMCAAAQEMARKRPALKASVLSSALLAIPRGGRADPLVGCGVRGRPGVDHPGASSPAPWPTIDGARWGQHQLCHEATTNPGASRPLPSGAQGDGGGRGVARDVRLDVRRCGPRPPVRPASHASPTRLFRFMYDTDRYFLSCCDSRSLVPR